MKCLFIGGPKAGLLWNIDSGVIMVRCPVLPPAHWVGEQEEQSNLSYKEVVYKLDFATDKAGKRHALYVLEDSGDPLIQLMEFYAASKHS